MSRFAQLKRQLRRVVHDKMAVDATYQTPSMFAAVSLSVRFHTRRAAPFGDIGDGFAQVIENTDRIVFDTEELAVKGIKPCRGAQVRLIEYGICVTLETRDPTTGPIEEIWMFSR